MCGHVDKALGEHAAMRHFLNHVDAGSRPAMRCDLPAEVKRALPRRGASSLTPAARATGPDREEVSLAPVAGVQAVPLRVRRHYEVTHLNPFGLQRLNVSNVQKLLPPGKCFN